jgi:hypothetical protein
VGEKDPVPSLLSLAHSVSAAKRQLEDKVRCDHLCVRNMGWPKLQCPQEFLYTIFIVFCSVADP